MPYAPLRYCAAPNCSERVAHGRCPQHARQQDRDRPNAEVRKLYMRAKWKRLRLEVLRDHPMCPECRTDGRLEPATDVHHLVKHDGDATRFYDRTLLVGLCARHHSRHTGRGE